MRENVGASALPVVPEEYSTIGLCRIGDMVIGSGPLDIQTLSPPFMGEMVIGNFIVGRITYIDLPFEVSTSSSSSSTKVSLSTEFNSSTNAVSSIDKLTLSIVDTASVSGVSSTNLSIAVTPVTSTTIGTSDVLVSLNATYNASSSTIESEVQLSCGVISSTYSSTYTSSVMSVAPIVTTKATSNSSCVLSIAAGAILSSNSTGASVELLSIGASSDTSANSSSSVVMAISTPVVTSSNSTGLYTPPVTGRLTGITTSYATSSATGVISLAYAINPSSASSSSSVVFTASIVPNKSAADAYTHSMFTVGVVPVVATSTLASEFKFTLAPSAKSISDLYSYWLASVSLRTVPSSSQSNTSVIPHQAGAIVNNRPSIGNTKASDVPVAMGMSIAASVGSTVSSTAITTTVVPTISVNTSVATAVLTQVVVTPVMATATAVGELTKLTVADSYSGHSTSTTLVTPSIAIAPLATTAKSTSSLQLSSTIYTKQSKASSKGVLAGIIRSLSVRLARSTAVSTKLRKIPTITTVPFRISKASSTSTIEVTKLPNGLSPVSSVVHSTGTAVKLTIPVTGITDSAASSTGTLNTVTAGLQPVESVATSTATLHQMPNGIWAYPSSSATVDSTPSVALQFNVTTVTSSCTSTNLHGAVVSSKYVSSSATSEAKCDVLSGNNKYVKSTINTSATLSSVAGMVAPLYGLNHPVSAIATSTADAKFSMGFVPLDTTSVNTSTSMHISIAYYAMGITSVATSRTAKDITGNSKGFYTIFQLALDENGNETTELPVDEEGSVLYLPADGIILLNYAADVAYDRLFTAPATSPRIFYTGVRS